jgi:hypothetical protein
MGGEAPHLPPEQAAAERWNELASRVTGGIAHPVIDERNAGPASGETRGVGEHHPQREADEPKHGPPAARAQRPKDPVSERVQW